MGLLLGLTGALLLASAATGIRSASRAGAGLSIGGLIDAAWAAGFFFAATREIASSSEGPTAGRILVPLGILWLIGSTSWQIRVGRERARRRNLTEGRRLESFVRYLAPDDPEEKSEDDA